MFEIVVDIHQVRPLQETVTGIRKGSPIAEEWTRRSNSNCESWCYGWDRSRQRVPGHRISHTEGLP